MGKAKKVMVIGLDAPIAPRVYLFAKDWKLPAIGSLIASGVYAKNCMVPYPTITPPNWTTIATGATLGTHGITCYNVHIPGDALDKTHEGFNTAECKAEYIWNAAERADKKSIILNYPSSWPSTIRSGIQIGGAGLCVNEWSRINGEKGGNTLSAEQLFATEEYPQASKINLQKAADWQNLPEDQRSLEAELKLLYRGARYPVQPKSWQLLAQDTKGAGFDRILLSKTKDANDAFATLSVGEWSSIITDDFDTAQGRKKAAFKCKLLELSPDGDKLKLYITGICALDGWSHPPSIAEEIKSEYGLPAPRSGFQALNLGWIDAETFVEVQDIQHTWYADAAKYLLRNKEWDLFFMQAHCPDFAYHAFSRKIEPLTAKDEKEVSLYQGIEISFYQSLDRMIGRIIEVAEKETLIIIVSDHGAKATTRGFNLGKVMADAGLMVFSEGLMPGRREVDWTKTKAVPQRSCYIYINVKGRDPQGIVEPGAEYEKVRDEVINALYNYTDPETGKKPILFALRKEDARIIGLYGEMVGDIVYALSPHFGGEHGNLLPTAEYGVGSLRGLFIMSGPGVKKNYVMERTMNLTDVIPTICHLTGFPYPRDAEGAILYQALE